MIIEPKAEVPNLYYTDRLFIYYIFFSAGI